MGADAPLLLPLRQPMPLARSILWSPAGGTRKGLGNIPLPIFLRQAALVAIHEHLAAPARAGQGLFGFLVGDLCECPETNVSYVVIDSALQLNQPIYSDRTMDVVTSIWDRIAAQAAEQKGHLIGWYHTHLPLPLALSAHDVETHKHHFAEPWQVALVVGTTGDAGEPAAGFFRAGADETWVSTPLPFYEVLSEESIRPGGKKRSFVTWKNYRAYNPVADRASRASPKAAAGSAEAPEPRAARETPPPKVAAPRTDELVFLTAAQDSPQPPARETPPPEAAVPKTDELVFLSAAEDSAHPSPSSPPPPAPPPPPPPREARWEPPAPPAPPPPPAPPAPSARYAPSEPVEESEEAVEELHPPTPLRPHPLTPSPQRGPHPLTPSPRGGEGERSVSEERGEERLEERFDEPVAQPVAEERPRRVRTARRSRRVRRWLRVGAFAILVAGAGAGYVRFKPSLPSLPSLPFPKRQATAPATRTSTPVPPLRTAERGPGGEAQRGPAGEAAVAATLTRAVRTFRERAALFDRGQVACGGLARALLAVEERWATYSTTRRASRVVDPGLAARDHALYAGVDSAERRFERSGCPRL